MGLDSAYASIWSNILTSEPLPNINKIFTTVAHEEMQKLVARNGGKPRPQCDYCGRLGHIWATCYQDHIQRRMVGPVSLTGVWYLCQVAAADQAFRVKTDDSDIWHMRLGHPSQSIYFDGTGICMNKSSGVVCDTSCREAPFQGEFLSNGKDQPGPFISSPGQATSSPGPATPSSGPTTSVSTERHQSRPTGPDPHPSSRSEIGDPYPSPSLTDPTSSSSSHSN
ncbi:hypothetical protein CRG98_031612 [Punica granatum]|uniref:CCHC-type domain-containing protein n=1 Tax=Punica granatum TaxID=22663 RepID=A0A2I0IVJ4_PUNGR|nr:hypothetical protein CRG98_031612 [Punica granatum]